MRPKARETNQSTARARTASKTKEEKEPSVSTSDDGEEVSISGVYVEFKPAPADEAQVLAVYKTIEAQYNKYRSEAAPAAWQRSLDMPIPLCGLVDDAVIDKEFPPIQLCPKNDDVTIMGTTKVTNEITGAKQEVTVIPIPGIPKPPNMQYWTHTERNIRSEDERTLSHIPFISENDQDLDFGKELLEDFEEGIHGVQFGCGKYINDWILHRMLKELLPKWKDRHPDILFKTIHALFPNKYSYRQLRDCEADLDQRFNYGPVQLPPGTVFNFEHESHSFNTIFCGKCMSYDCQQHGMVDSTDTWIVKGTTHDVDDDDKFVDATFPCGDKCYSKQKGSPISKSTIKWEEPVSQDFAEGIIKEWIAHNISNEKLLPCMTTEVINTMLQGMGVAKRVECSQMAAYIKPWIKEFNQNVCETTEQKTKKKKVDHHQMFRAARYKNGMVSISHQVQPCNHQGRKCEPGVCDCIRDNNVCTKFCKCVDCAHKFPGCKCQPGRCQSKQCACFLANFECDPALCLECGCDTSPDFAGPTLCTNIQLQRGFQKKLSVGVSEVAGWGCFVDEDVKKGELLSEYCGEIISTEESERRGRVYDKLKCSYIFKLNDEQSVDATRVGNLIRFANHCDQPNCAPKVMIVNGDHRIGIYAKQDIAKGEELFFNYSYDRVAKMKFVNNPRTTVPDASDGKKHGKEKATNSESKSAKESKKSKNDHKKEKNDASDSKKGKVVTQTKKVGRISQLTEDSKSSRRSEPIAGSGSRKGRTSVQTGSPSPQKKKRHM